MIGSRVKYTLTQSQVRVLNTQRMNPMTSMYNIGGMVRITGEIDCDVLRKAICSAVNSQDCFRIRLFEEDGEVWQCFTEENCDGIEYLDFSNEKNPANCSKEFCETKLSLPFDIFDNRLYYFGVFKVSNQEYGYYIVLHHIIADGWSVQILVKKISELYNQLLLGITEEDVSDMSYKNFIDSEQCYLLSKQSLKDKYYWLSKFETLPKDFDLPEPNINGKRETFWIDDILSNDIREFCKDNNLSINSFFVLVYAIYLNKIQMRDDVIVGIPVLGRRDKRERNIMGMFVSSLPVYIRFNEEATIFDTLKSVHRDILEGYKHQRYPYNFLIKDLNLYEKGFQGLFSTCVNYYGTHLNNDMGDNKTSNTEYYNGQQDYNLQLIIREWNQEEGFQIDFDYKTACYADEEVADLFRHILVIARNVIVSSGMQLKTLCLLDNEDELSLNLYNQTEQIFKCGCSILDIIQKQVDLKRDCIAISDDYNTLTYGELDEKSSRLAAFLNSKNITCGSTVAIIMKPSIEVVIAILGVLKSGAAYVPIDPSYPRKRIQVTVQEADCSIVLVDYPYDLSLSDREIMDIHSERLYEGLCCWDNATVNEHSAAYVIYTSGSTGTPKGILIEQKSLVNYVCWAQQQYVKSPDDVFAFYSSIAFDLTVTSIFVPLVRGCRIRVYREDEERHVIYKVFEDGFVNIIKLTPAHLSLIKDITINDSMHRTLIVGGEIFTTQLAQEVYRIMDGNVDMYNEYGPTEATVGCMIYKFDINTDHSTSVPIGKPISNAQIYILDRNGNPVPRNAIGEMFISGDCLARGYVNREDLTDKKFCQHSLCGGKRMYQTGDLARFIRPDCMEYLGRADRQVKIHGYRIELEEIERVLLMYPGVEGAVIADMSSEKVVLASSALVAYVIARSIINVKEVVRFLGEYLPKYMIPWHIIQVDEIPLTINGKVDIASLPKPVIGEKHKNDVEELSDERFEVLKSVITDVLRVKQIFTDDNFFEIGGDSIKAIQIASRLHKNGIQLKTVDIMANPIIEDMIMFMKFDYENKGKQISKDHFNFTPIIGWFFNQHFEQENYYNQSIELKLSRKITIECLETILNKLIMSHDSFCMNYDEVHRDLFYNVQLRGKAYKIPVYNVQDMNEEDRICKMAQIEKEVKSSIDITGAILIHTCIFQINQDEMIWFITIHHLAVDAISIRIILEDVLSMLQSIDNDDVINTSSFQSWSNALTKYSRESLKDSEQYWSSIMTKTATSFITPKKESAGVDTLNYITVILNQEDTSQLVKIGNNLENIALRDLLITSLVRTIKQCTKSTEIVIELEAHGREEIGEAIDVTRTVGWFTCLYPFYVCLESDDIKANMDNVKLTGSKIKKNGLEFGILKNMDYFFEYKNKKYVRFNYLGDFSNVERNEYYELLDHTQCGDIDDVNHVTYLVEINCMLINGKLKFVMSYSMEMYEDTVINDFGQRFLNELNEVIKYCSNRKEMEIEIPDYDTTGLSLDELDRIFI